MKGPASGWPIFSPNAFGSRSLAIDVFLRLQTFHVGFQVRPVGIIWHARESGLHFLDGFVEVTLPTVDAGHTNVRGPIIRELLRVGAINSEGFFLLFLSLQLAAVEVKLLSRCLFQRLASEFRSCILAAHGFENVRL